MSSHGSSAGFDLRFTDREVSAWGGLALLKRMLDQMALGQALSGCDLPQPGSNRGYDPVQLIEQWIVSIWCGACRFAHADTVRMDGTLTRLFGWTRAACHRAIVRLFRRFDMARNLAVQESMYSWFLRYGQHAPAGHPRHGLHGIDPPRPAGRGYQGIHPRQAGPSVLASLAGFCGRRPHGGQLLAAAGQRPYRQLMR